MDTGTFLDELPDEERPYTPPAWDKVAAGYQKQFPTLDVEEMQTHYEDTRQKTIQRVVRDYHMQAARKKYAGMEETTGSYLLRNMIPGASTVLQIRQPQEYDKARRRFEAGNPEPADYETIAGHERAAQLDQERNSTLGGKIQTAAVGMPALIGETMAGAPFVKGIGAAAKVSVPVYTGRLAVQTALTPSIVVKPWTDANMEQGRDPLDIRGLPAAFGMAMTQNAILGTLGNNLQGVAKVPGLGTVARLQGPGIGTALARQGAKGVLGVGETAAADLATGAVQDVARKLIPEWTRKETHYGTLGDMLDGKKGEAAQNAIVQALTFAAFGTLHEIQHGTPAGNLKRGLKEFGEQAGAHAEEMGQVAGLVAQGADSHGSSKPIEDYYRAMGKRGLNLDAANQGLNQVHDRLATLMQDNNDPSRADAHLAMEGLPEGPVQDYAKWVADRFPENPASKQKATAPPEPQKAPQAAAEAAAVPKPAEPAAAVPEVKPASALESLKPADLKALAEEVGAEVKEGMTPEKMKEEIRNAVGDDRMLENLAQHRLEPDVAEPPPEPVAEGPPPLGPPGKGVEPILPPARPGMPAAFPETEARGRGKAPKEVPAKEAPPPAPAERPEKWQRVDRAYEKWIRDGMERGSAHISAVNLARSIGANDWVYSTPGLEKAAIPSVGGEVLSSVARAKNDAGWDIPGRTIDRQQVREAAGVLLGREITPEEFHSALDRLHKEKLPADREAAQKLYDEMVANGFTPQQSANTARHKFDLTNDEWSPGTKPATLPPEVVKPEPAKPAEPIGKKVETPEAEPKPAGTLEQLHQRMAEGDTPSPEEWADAAGLTEQERVVFLGQMADSPKTLEELGKKLGVKRQRAKQIADAAIAKMGGEQTVDQARKVLQADAALEMLERGGQVSPEQLHADPEMTSRKINKRQAKLDAIDAEMERLMGELIKESDNGTLSPERTEEIRSRVAELNAQREGGHQAKKKPAQRGRREPAPIPEVAPAAEPFGSGKRPLIEKGAMEAAKDFFKEEEGSWDYKLHAHMVLTKAAELYVRMKSAIRHLRRNYAEMAGQMKPETTKLDRRTGEALAELDVVKTFAKEQAVEKIDQVLGNASKAERELYGNAINEMQLRHTRDAWKQKAADEDAALMASLQTVRAAQQRAAAATNPQDKRIAQAQAAAARAQARQHAERATESIRNRRGVRSALGPDEPIQDDAGYQRVLQDPKFQQIRPLWEQHMVPEMEGNFKEAQGMEDTDPINSFTQVPGFPVNLMPRKTELPGDKPQGAGQGNLKGTYQGKLHFANERKGNAPDGYVNDLGDIITNSLEHGALRAAKARVFRTAQENGVGQFGTPGQQVEIDGAKTREIPHVFPPKGTQEAENRETSFYVKEEAYDEFRKSMKTDRSANLEAVGAASGILTKASLASTVEAAYHSKNLLTMFFKPGMGYGVGFIKNLAGVIRGDKGLRSDMVELARIGALKGEGMETGLILPKDYAHLDPTYWAGKSLDVLQRAMRLTANQAYDTLVNRGQAVDTQTARRNFINQLGQYERSSQSDYVRFLRDTGLGPFATAGTNYWVQGQRAMTLGHGAQSTSWKAEIALRAEYAARLASAAGLALATNYVLWGRPDGDDKVPLGAIKTGEKDGKSTYFNVTDLTGLTRGMRQTGMLSLAEGIRHDEGSGKIIDKAGESIMHSALHPATGPMVQFLHTAATGKSMLGQRLADKPDVGGSELPQNLEAAIRNANPTLGTLAGWDRPNEKDATLWDRTARLAGPFGLKSTSAMEPVVRNYYDRLRDLEEHRRDDEDRKKGKVFAYEAEYRKLHAIKPRMDEIAHLLRDERRVADRVVSIRPLDEEQKKRLREAQTDLARKIMAK